MRRRVKPRVTWLGRVVRGLRPDRNALRRGTDVAEAVIKAGLLAVFLALAPVLVMTAVHLTHTATTRTMRAEHSSWRRLHAILLGTAPYVIAYGLAAGVPVEARWTLPDGSRRTGEVTAPPGTRAGSTVAVWIDRSGKPTGPPLPRSAVAARESLAAALTVIALALVLAYCGTVTRRMLDRRRLGAWERDWAATEPRWTRRR